MPWSSWAREPQLWRLCSRAHWAHRLSSCGTSAPQAKPLQWEAWERQLESISHLLHLEKSPHSNEDPAQPEKKINHIYIYKKYLDPCDVPDTLLCWGHSSEQNKVPPLTVVEWANRKQASGDSIWGCCLQDAGPTNTISDRKWGEGGNWDKGAN